MAPSIILSDSTFTKLQQLATPFVDTPESVITRLAEQELQRRGSGGGKSATANDVRELDVDRHESLKHARLIAATVDGKELHRPKWNNLLDQIHIMGRAKLGSFEALAKATGARIRPGRYETEGFHYLPEADLSIQGLDANLAWQHSLGLARHLRVAIAVTFEWREKDGAALPGQTAKMQWVPPRIAAA